MVAVPFYFTTKILWWIFSVILIMLVMLLVLGIIGMGGLTETMVKGQASRLIWPNGLSVIEMHSTVVPPTMLARLCFLLERTPSLQNHHLHPANLLSPAANPVWYPALLLECEMQAEMCFLNLCTVYEVLMLMCEEYVCCSIDDEIEID